MTTVVLLGTGNVATHLFNAFQQTKKIKVVQIFSRNISKNNVGNMNPIITDNLKELIDADLYIIAVSDDAIAQVSDQLQLKNKLVVHTSGSTPMAALNTKNRRGVFYPLQSFSKEKAVDFNKIPLCLEAESKGDETILEKVAKAITPKTYFISSEQRKAMHIAAVFVNNFVNHLYHIGNEICLEHHIPFEILQPLIQETAQKVQIINPVNAQTGPARRNDEKTINSQLEQLNNKTHKEIYELMTRSLIETYGREKL
ncbi:DUF2520 domain-containing protein [Zhouia spongiae]|uniref:DUF2520 domain-containing protein n=1 Tax=Zhouia spongiae TaxID=2202721 RepID=A0ABY3YIY2_9FLAO|nr:DUF2520 domain-containing protein [Zhouia spongiae]UNY97814.1 DUF2520 domain-containing protein [Zhouia spongiae]